MYNLAHVFRDYNLAVFLIIFAVLQLSFFFYTKSAVVLNFFSKLYYQIGFK